MKLTELAYMLGDDGGMHNQLAKSLENLKAHSTSHKNEKIRGLCKDAIGKLNYHSQHPASWTDDPHTMLRVLSHFQGDLDENRLRSAVDTLGSYFQSDAD